LRNIKGGFGMEIFIITGFLGSGKTSLLNHLIKDVNEEGKRIAVIMNEFGKRTVDSELIQSDVTVNEIINGCICCEMKDDVAHQLHMLYIEQQPEIVLIECSGIAHPLEVLDACLTPVLSPFITIRSIIGIIDIPEYQKLSTYSKQTQQLIDVQLKYCQDIIVNKLDLIDSCEAINVIKSIQEQYPRAETFSTTYGKVSYHHLSKKVKNIPFKNQNQNFHNHIYHKYYSIDKPVQIEKFKLWLQNLSQKVYRVKGFITFENSPNKYLVQISNSNVLIEKYDIDIDDYLILIGEKIDEENIFFSLY